MDISIGLIIALIALGAMAAAFVEAWRTRSLGWLAVGLIAIVLAVHSATVRITS